MTLFSSILIALLGFSCETKYSVRGVKIVRNGYKSSSTQLYLNQFINAYTKSFQESEYSNLPLSSNPSELPASFQDAVERAASISVTCFNSGKSKCRIDFDTTVGDMTYTSLKNTLPMAKELVIQLADKMGIESLNKPLNLNDDNNDKSSTEQQSSTVTPIDGNTSGVEEKTSTTSSNNISANMNKAKRDMAKEVMAEINKDVKDTIRLVFPDMGAAALARRDWKMGTFESLVPFCVQTSNIQNDVVMSTDKVVIILCPQYSETEYVERIMDLCDVQNTPCIIINPELINMDQGFGVKARRIRNEILNAFTTSYKLKTLKNGALVREWPGGYTVWCEDAESSDGYRLLKAYESDPPREAVNEMFDELFPDPETLADSSSSKSNPALVIASSITTFFKGMSKL